MRRGPNGSLKRSALAAGLLLAWAHGCSIDEQGTLDAAAGSGGANAGSAGATAGGGSASKGGGTGTGGSRSNQGGQGGEAATAGTDAGAGGAGGEAGTPNAGGEAGMPSAGGDGGSSGSGGSTGAGGTAGSGASGGSATQGGAAGQGGAPGGDCEHSVDCTDIAAPVCDSGACVAGTDECNSDDASEPGNDGPAGAVSLGGSVGTRVVRSGTICSRPASEADYFLLNVLQRQGLSLSLDWTGNANLDLEVIDANGMVVGTGGPQHPALIVLTHLGVGVYYVRVTRSGASNPSATAYTVTSTRTAADACAGNGDCDDVYENQLYRGSCSNGACVSITAGSRAAGSPCDSDDDCASGLCSYQPFESDAAKSVCTVACSVTSDCTSLGADFRCTSGSSGNRCVPSCVSDLECGANVASQTPDPQRSWAYWSCNAGNGSCAR